MSLVVLTGGVRSGKSSAAQRMAEERGAAETLVVVAAHEPADGEMARRVERHRAQRPESFRTLEVHENDPWTDRVPDGACLVVECLGTLVAQHVGAAFGRRGEVTHPAELVSEDVEAEVTAAVDALVEWLLDREADTILVTNEVGSGIVPAHPDARLFRDVLGAANRRLVDGADAAFLMVAGRCVDLTALPNDAYWPPEG